MGCSPAGNLRVPQDREPLPADIAAEHDPAGPAAFGDFEDHARRAEDVAGVEEQRAYTGHGSEPGVIVDRPKPGEGLPHVADLVQRLERVLPLLLSASIHVPDIGLLDMGRVDQHVAAQLFGGRRGEDLPSESAPGECREIPAVIDVRVGEENALERSTFRGSRTERMTGKEVHLPYQVRTRIDEPCPPRNRFQDAERRHIVGITAGPVTPLRVAARLRKTAVLDRAQDDSQPLVLACEGLQRGKPGSQQAGNRCAGERTAAPPGAPHRLALSRHDRRGALMAPAPGSEFRP